jgi:hypothetical protein
VVGKDEPFLEAELDFMDGWFEGEAGVDLAVRVAMPFLCVCMFAVLSSASLCRCVVDNPRLLFG